ncbi:MAG TPA: AI-2E family transporter [Cellvibrio sp.]|nr:AI-2E family transporter [Cellvibrio sp.]
MTTPPNTPSHDQELADRISNRLLDVLIRFSLCVILVALCYRVFAPFLTLMVWALILAVTLYPLHRSLARKVGGKQWLAATILVILGSLILVAPTALIMNSLGDSIREVAHGIQDNTLTVRAPKESVKSWPVIGETVYSAWSKAHTDLHALVHGMQPKIGDLARKALGVVASIGGGLLLFLASFIIAGIIMTFGESGAHASRNIFVRIAGKQRGESMTILSTATIRAVAQGVIGVAFIQAIIVGIALLVAGVPWAGVLAIITMVLGIAQIPAFIVTLPAIIYIWSSGDYSTGMATTHTIILLIAGLADNVLKPLMLGRGVDAPMPVILFGALGGMASAGIIGMFVGATLLALGYRIFMEWVNTGLDAIPASAPVSTSPSNEIPPGN